MENTPRLYDTLVTVLGQHRKWLDIRHLKTLAWMMVGLIGSGQISLTAWAPYTQSNATYAQSTVRRFARWLDNDRIHVNTLYGPLIQSTLTGWGEHVLYLALDTSMLWGRYCIVRISVIFRGRAVPLVWKVLEHNSSSVAYSVYKDLLDEAAKLLPLGCRVVFLADRGFVDRDLMHHLQRLGWHWRIRIKANILIHRCGHVLKLSQIALESGRAYFWHHVFITAQRLGPVHLALARRADNCETWFVVSDEPTNVTTFDEYGLRFDVEENFLDDKSNGFQLESSMIRSAQTLNRLCFVLAMTTLYLVSQGVEVEAQGQRRSVDPHWERGSSYLKIGWNWVKRALVNSWALITRLCLPGGPDPSPAISSQRQFRKQIGPAFRVEFVDYAL
jgi:hypothetical protein